MRSLKLILITASWFVVFNFTLPPLGFLFCAEKAAAPGIKFKEKIYDFGAVGSGDKVMHNYAFTNAGQEILIIKEVRPSCGCIAALVSSNEIAPGGTGVVKVTFHTEKYTGRQTRTVSVYSNDPGQPEVDLTIQGNIEAEFALEPESVQFGDIEKGTSITKAIKLIQLGKEELILNKAEAISGYFSTRIFPLIDEKQKGFKIEIVLNPNVAVGQFNEVITLHTNLPKHLKLDVPVWGNVLGRIKVKPQMVSLGAFKKGTSSKTYKIEVTSTDSRKFNISKVVSDMPFLSAKLVKNKDNEFEIILEIDKNAPAAKLQAMVTIFTDEISQPEIKIPVYGLVEK